MKEINSKLLLGLVIGATVGAAIGYLVASDKKEEILEEINGLASTVKKKFNQIVDSHNSTNSEEIETPSI